MDIEAVFVMITILVLCSLTICLIPQSSGLYTDEFVVQILGGVEEARAVADELGFTYVRPVSSRHFICFLR